jgi:hypothetical protein
MDSVTFEPLRAALAGRYTIERELGRGGMATVYLAHCSRGSRSSSEHGSGRRAVTLLSHRSTIGSSSSATICPRRDSGSWSRRGGAALARLSNHLLTGATAGGCTTGSPPCGLRLQHQLAPPLHGVALL